MSRVRIEIDLAEMKDTIDSSGKSGDLSIVLQVIAKQLYEENFAEQPYQSRIACTVDRPTARGMKAVKVEVVNLPS